MTSPPSVATFYDDARLGNLFRVRGPYYDDFGHRGVDFVHAARVPVPSWCSGRVVVSTFYRTLGETVIVDRGSGAGLDRFAGYCHLTTGSRIERGEYVNVGDVVGTVGSTGTLSSGPHLHATLEPAVTIGTRNARDPLPLIRKAVASLSLAGGGGAPIETELDEMTIPRIIAPHGLDARAVVGGGLAYVFPNAGELAHYRNFERSTTPSIDSTTTVGDASMSPAARMAVFDTIVRIHQSAQGVQNAVAAVPGRVEAVLADELAAVTGGGADLAPLLAAINAQPEAFVAALKAAL